MLARRRNKPAFDRVLDVPVFGQIPSLVEFYRSKYFPHNRSQEIFLDPKMSAVFLNEETLKYVKYRL